MMSGMKALTSYTQYGRSQSGEDTGEWRMFTEELKAGGEKRLRVILF